MAVKPFNVMDLGKVALFDPKEMGYRDSLDIIKEESVKIQKSFVKIGWYLKHIQENELYCEDGYANIYECAASQFGYSQSTVSRFIGICEKFSKDHDSPELDEKYEGFDKSQMIEMLPMDQAQLEKVTPEMTVKQIRDIKNDGKKETKNSAKKKAESPVEGNNAEEIDLTTTTSLDSEFELQEENYATSHKESEENEPDEDSQSTEEVVVDGAYKEMVMSPREMTQPELPILKNNDQRKDWLSNYKAWGLWYRDENIDVNYYKFDFEDGSRLIVAEYPNRHSLWGDGWRDEFFYHLLKKNRKTSKGKSYDESFRNQTNCETDLVEFLKNIQKRKVGEEDEKDM